MLSLSLAAAAANSLAAAAPNAPLHFSDLHLSRTLFTIGSFELRWYSLAYLAGIIFAYWHVSKMLRAPGAPMAQRHADDLFFYCTLGIIIGGRLGYATFYDPALWTEPLELLQLWNGGMSFHGGLAGVTLAIAWVAWRGGLNFLRVCDTIAVTVPAGMLFGRLANFVNGELWGRVTESAVPWAIVFDGAAGPLPRHPSQLYEAGLEGLALLIVLLLLFWKTRARWRPGLLVGTFTAGIAAARFTVEYFREPDEQLQEFARQTGLSMGQWLTIPLLLVGLFFMVRALRRPLLNTAAAPAATPD